MDLPPKDERRTVPRHLRDSEHDRSGMAPGSGRRAEDARNARLGVRVWIYAAVSAVMVATAIWLGIGAS